VTALGETRLEGDALRVRDAPDPVGRWVKRGDDDRDRTYPDGFDLALGVRGAESPAHDPGEPMFGATTAPLPLKLTLTGAGIDAESALSDYVENGEVTLSAELLSTGKVAVVSDGLPGKLRIRFSPRSGILRGKLTLTDDLVGKTVKRTIVLQGLYVPEVGAPEASTVTGFFLRPEPPVGDEPANRTPIDSGGLRLGR
jgi:hypothetical protein